MLPFGKRRIPPNLCPPFYLIQALFTNQYLSDFMFLVAPLHVQARDLNFHLPISSFCLSFSEEYLLPLLLEVHIEFKDESSH
jgi:hypothetical protein